MAAEATTLPEIEIAVTQSDAASKTLTVTVPVDRVQAAEAKTARWYSQRAKVPGFRQGKVPEPVVRRRFGDAIRQSVLEELLRESWDRARTEQGITPVGDPRVRILKFEQGEPLSFELTVDVRPEIKLDRIEGFKLTRRVPKVTDENIDAQMLQLRESKAPWMPAEGRAKEGDLVEATIANLDEGADQKSEPVRFVLGQGRALPDLEAQIMQLDPGGTWEGNIRFPEDHPDEARRGQSRAVRVTLHEVKRQAVPDLTDDFAREQGPFETLAALRDAVKADLEAEASREADARLRSELVDQIAAANNVSVPPSLLHRALHAYAHAYGVPEEKHHDFEKEFRPMAEAQVRRDLIIEAVADMAKLHVTSETLDARINEIAARRGESPAAVKASLEQNNRLRELERAITDENVFAHLLGKSAVDDAPAAR
ncbi:MAG TPA: trigger factor [Gemmatimonadales bacterium]|jgi:trigger factor